MGDTVICPKCFLTVRKRKLAAHRRDVHREGRREQADRITSLTTQLAEANARVAELEGALHAIARSDKWKDIPAAAFKNIARKALLHGNYATDKGQRARDVLGDE